MSLPTFAPRRLALAVTAVMVAALTALPVNTATAAPPTFGYAGLVGGTQITALGMGVESDLTARSAVNGLAPDSDSNSIAKVKVGTLARVGAVTTDATGTKFGNGHKIVTRAKTADISLLGGLIKADAVETTATASANSKKAPKANVKTKLIGLTIAGKKYPMNVPANTGITIPGVASIVLNAQITGAAKDGAAAYGGALRVTLLKQRGQAAAGAEIILNPVAAKVDRAANAKDGQPIGGYSYGSYVYAGVGNDISVESQRTAALVMPAYGTDGQTLTNSTARVNLAGVLRAGAIESTASGIQSIPVSDSKHTASIADVNLFSGLIRAKAISTSAHAQASSSTGRTTEGSMDFVNLRIAGQQIPINVPPNTKIDVAGLGTVTLNKQEMADVPGKGVGIVTVGLEVVLDTSRAGLPVGAVVQLAYSAAVVFG